MALDNDAEDSDAESSPASTPSPYAHLSRLSKAHGHAGGHLLPVPAWSPGLRVRTAHNREVLLVARNAREQAKENEFLRTRVRELEEEIAEGSERMHRARAALEAGESAVEASAASVRQLEDRLDGAKQCEVVLKAEAAAHAAAAEQLTLELERMRAIEEQTSLEAVALIQKTSRLQNELNASARQAAIAEEMLEGVQVEGERALEASECAMMELQRRLHELDADELNDDPSTPNDDLLRGTRAGGVAGDLASLLDLAMGEASALREVVASAASEAGRWRAEASRVERAHGQETALERGYQAAVAELKELREENGFLRSDLVAMHSGMAAEVEATCNHHEVGGDGGGAGVSGAGESAGGGAGADNKTCFLSGAFVNVSRHSSAWVGGGGGSPPRKGIATPRFSSPARSSFIKELRKRESSKGALGNGGVNA
jgi:hypothetical protein